MNSPPEGKSPSRMFQIHEDDLLELEKGLPILCNAQSVHLGPRERTIYRRLKEIISNVRWDYGPHTNAEIIDP